MSVCVCNSDEDYTAAFAAATAAGKAIVVDFTAEWCGPCKMIAPAFEELANQHTGCVFMKVDVDKCDGTAASNGVSAMPTFMVFVGGKKVDSFSGANKEKLSAMVAKWAKTGGSSAASGMESQFGLLKDFIGACQRDASILHHPQLAFFRDYIESLGGKIPAAPAPSAAGAGKCPFSGEKKAEEPKKEQPKEEPMDEDIPMPDLDMDGVVENDSSEPLPMGDGNKEVSDEDMDKSGEERDAAMAAFSKGEVDKCIEHYTNAIELNPHAAALFAKRANALLRQKKCNAAIADCDRAIELNPDSAAGYKFRGRAKRLLGQWVEAHKDLATACRIDYDDTANEWLKEVEKNAKKMQEYNRAKERVAAEKELRERRERVRRAQEENERARKEQEEREKEMGGGMPGFGGMPGMGGMGGGAGGIPPGLADLLNDPDMMEAMQDPEVLPAFMEVMQNPSALMKHMNNPKIMNLFAKMQSKAKGGAGGMPTGMNFGGCGGGPCDDPDCGPTPSASQAPPKQNPPTKAPEPDLD